MRHISWSCSTAVALFAYVLLHDPPGVHAVRVVPRGFHNGYHTIAEVETALDALYAASPAVTKLIQIGTSYEGRPIRALCAGLCFDSSTEAAAPPPALLITALHHAREPVGMVAALTFMDTLLDAANASVGGAVALLSHRAVWIVPTVNPDGYAANLAKWGSLSQMMIRKNRRRVCSSGNNPDFGVDLNRNYDFAFTYDDLGSNPHPCTEDYRGTAAFSEPESAAIKGFVSSYAPSIALNWHSYGRFINLPYAVKGVAPPPIEVYDTLLNLASGFSNLTGFGYGHPYDGGLYTVNGEASDWMLAAAGTFAMSPELGPKMDDPFETGMWPLAAQLPHLVEEAISISDRAAWAAGSLLELGAVRRVSLGQNTASAACADGSTGCDVVDVQITVRNNGVKDSDGTVLAVLVDALSFPASAFFSSDDDASCAVTNGTWRQAGVPVCGSQSGGSSFGATAAPSAAAMLLCSVGTAADLLPVGLVASDSDGGGRTLRRQKHRRRLHHRPSMLHSEMVLQRATALRREGDAAAATAAAAAARFSGPITEEDLESIAARSSQRRLDLRDVSAVAHADSRFAQQQPEYPQQRVLAASSLEGKRTVIAGGVPASFVYLDGGNDGEEGGDGVLPAQHETVVLGLRVVAAPHNGGASCSVMAAAAAARSACPALGAGGSSVQHPVAFLVLSDDSTCSIYGVACDGSIDLLDRGRTGCAPCAMFRTQAWEAAIAAQSTAAARCFPSAATALATASATPTITTTVTASTTPLSTPPLNLSFSPSNSGGGSGSGTTLPPYPTTTTAGADTGVSPPPEDESVGRPSPRPPLTGPPPHEHVGAINAWTAAGALAVCCLAIATATQLNGSVNAPLSNDAAASAAVFGAVAVGAVQRRGVRGAGTGLPTRWGVSPGRRPPADIPMGAPGLV